MDLASGNSSFYASADGGVLTGDHVLDNYKFQGQVGARFRVGNWPGHGNLTLGGDLFGMHYNHNEVGLTYGQGGYFSPSYYVLASVPVTFNGNHKSRFHYLLSGAVGMQTFGQDQAPFYPLDPILQLSFVPPVGVVCTGVQANSYNCGQYPQITTTSVNYSVRAQTSYRFGEHGYGGGFVFANNTNNYNDVSGGFFFRYVFGNQPSSGGYPTGQFPVQGFRPLRIP